MYSLDFLTVHSSYAPTSHSLSPLISTSSLRDPNTLDKQDKQDIR